MITTSKVLKKPLDRWFSKSKVPKKTMAEVIGTSKQSPTDWTKDKPHPVTPDNAVRISDFANDTDLTMSIVYKFFGIFRPMDGNTYRRDLNASDGLRELEEDERDHAKELVRRMHFKEVGKLKNKDFELLLRLSKEQAEAVFANIQYLNALCEVQNISIMDLFDEFMKEWQEVGYFGGD